MEAAPKRAKAAGGRGDSNPVQDLGIMFNRTVENPDG
jgi:hypothetical protein